MPRSKIDIFVQVLEKARNETTENIIMSQGNLNEKLAPDLLKLLTNLNLLVKKRARKTARFPI